MENLFALQKPHPANEKGQEKQTKANGCLWRAETHGGVFTRRRILRRENEVEWSWGEQRPGVLYLPSYTGTLQTLVRMCHYTDAWQNDLQGEMCTPAAELLLTPVQNHVDVGSAHFMKHI